LSYLHKMPTTFEPVNPVSFPAEERRILQYWREIDAFKESVRQSKAENRPEYIFYDGPPFATGLPHYGHILAGTIKDVVTRYAHMKGYHVERRFGWDCHGLPIEYEIDKKLGLKGRPDVMKMGIDKYNEECRGIVTRYTKEWREIVERFGRWVDFDNDYKTMDVTFMESTWWVFKELFDKGLVYRAFRVMPFSTACGTALSNFEVSQNYKEVSDPSIIVQFKVTKEKNRSILAWTTTPWTLPSNVALCVNPKLKYLIVQKDDGHEWIVGKDRWPWVCSCLKKDPKTFKVLKELEGKDLVGTGYEPLFEYFRGKVVAGKAWHVVADGYVSTEAGTCIVHQAPAFGEDDNRVCLAAGIIQKDGTGMVCPVDDTGCFSEDVTDFKGQNVKDADKDIKEKLKQQGSLVYNGTEVHNYPHCWRSDTPLIYKAVASWFVKVEEKREQLIACNNETYWVPAFVKEKRFHNWLSEARDWCISRSRYWGTPIPLWVSSDFEEIVCVGSLEELEKHAGRKITDIHRHFIDDIEIPSKKGKGMLKRVDEVFDCWFESGSMPYSQKHYPFENKSEFEKGFPAQFIAEGLDQTRGWFYTLMVLSTHLFNKPAFKNLIVNGLVLAADGKKMSKRLKNYPDPSEIVESHGADAVRMYLCNSPVVRAEPLKFKEEGVRDVVKDVFLPWYNAYRFLVQEVGRYEGSGQTFRPDPERIKQSDNLMDKWINASCHGLIAYVREEIEAYHLYTVVPRLVNFLEDLTNVYIRMNRDRMRGTQGGADEALTALCTLYDVLLNATVLLAPITPFITEMLYQNLSRALPDDHKMKAKSVHWVPLPETDSAALDPEIMRAVERMRAVVELGRGCRERRKVGMRKPLKSMSIMSKDQEYVKDLKTLQTYIEQELFVMEVNYSSEADKVQLSGVLNFKVLGKSLGKNMKAVQQAAKELSNEDLMKFEETGKITICGHEIGSDGMQVVRSVKDMDDPNKESASDSSSLVVLDFTRDEDLELIALARKVANKVQTLRKAAGLQQDDPVDMWTGVMLGKKSNGMLAKALGDKKDVIEKQLRKPFFSDSLMQGHEVVVSKETFDEMDDDSDDQLVVTITVRAPFFNIEALKKLTGGDAKAEACCREFVQTFGLDGLARKIENGGLVMRTEAKSYELRHQEHFALGPADAPWLKR